MTGFKVGGRGLSGATDDATSKVTGGLFTQAESSWGYFTDREDRGLRL
jgi:hypothetical protein